MLYSELAKKKVFRLDGTALGAVVGAVFDKQNAALVGICAERGIFAVADMYAAKDVVTLIEQSVDLPLPEADEHMFLTTGMPVYDCKGEAMGRFADFYVDPHNKKEEVFMTDSDSFALKKLLFTADGTAIVNQGDQLPRKRRKNRVAETATKTTQYPAPINPPIASTTATQQSTADRAIALDLALPDTQTMTLQAALSDQLGSVIDYKNYGDYRFLMGRSLVKPIYDLNHNVVISAGTVVTPDVVELAKLRGKLTELTKHSK